jgi:E3 SUMO-protein ligase RanBP2
VQKTAPYPDYRFITRCIFIFAGCKLFLADDTLLTNPVRAKYWCDLADSEQLQNENVLSLKLKLTKDSRIVEDLLVKETIARPTDVNLRIRLVKHFLDEQKVAMALKYCNDVALKFNVAFMQSIDWHNCVAVTLAAYQNGGDKVSTINQWDIWLLQMLTIEQQIGLNLATDTNVLSSEEANMKETVRLLFEYDQLLQKASEVVIVICGEKELAGTFLQHYRGQLCLHMASYLFKVEQVYNRNQWRDTTRKCLPLLLLAHQCG